MNGFKLGQPGFINIRGTNGTGKSFMMRQFITEGATLHNIEDLNCAYYDCGTHYVIGSYANSCGGLDGVKGTHHETKNPDGMRSYESGQKAIMRLAKEKTVFAEGLIFSGTFKGTQEVFDELKAAGVPMFVFTIDIELDAAIESVMERRVKKGNVEPMNIDNVISVFMRSYVTYNKCVDYGMHAYKGDRDAVKQAIHGVLEGVKPTLTQEKVDMDKLNAYLKTMKGKEVVPTQAQIDTHLPKPTTNSLFGFF